MPRVSLDNVTINDPDRGQLPVQIAAGATLNTGQLAVTTTAAQVVGQNLNRYSVVITNTGTTTVYLGGSAVTTTTGQALPAGQSITFRTTVAIYAIAAGTGNTLTYAEESL